MSNCFRYLFRFAVAAFDLDGAVDFPGRSLAIASMVRRLRRRTLAKVDPVVFPDPQSQPVYRDEGWKTTANDRMRMSC